MIGVRHVRIPQGKSEGSWFSCVYGVKLTRREGLRILLGLNKGRARVIHEPVPPGQLSAWEKENNVIPVGLKSVSG